MNLEAPERCYNRLTRQDTAHHIFCHRDEKLLTHELQKSFASLSGKYGYTRERKSLKAMIAVL